MSPREQEAPGDHDRRDARAGFAVRTVWREFEIGAEGLILVVGAHAAGYVGAAREGVLVLELDRVDQFGVIEFDPGIDRAGR